MPLLLVKQNELCQQNSELTEVAEGSFPAMRYGSLVWTSALQEYSVQQEMGLREGSPREDTPYFVGGLWFGRCTGPLPLLKVRLRVGHLLKGTGSSELMDLAWNTLLYFTTSLSLQLERKWHEQIGGYISEVYPGEGRCDFCPVITSQCGTVVRVWGFTLCFAAHMEKGYRMSLESKGRTEILSRQVTVIPLHKALLLWVPDLQSQLFLWWRLRESRVSQGIRYFVQGCCSSR